MSLDTHQLEQHTTITKLPRQSVRQMLRKPGRIRCGRCGHGLTDPTICVLDNYRKVSHRECAERINEYIDELNDKARAERLEQAGIVLAKPNLITL